MAMAKGLMSAATEKGSGRQRVSGKGIGSAASAASGAMKILSWIGRGLFRAGLGHR